MQNYVLVEVGSSKYIVIYDMGEYELGDIEELFNDFSSMEEVWDKVADMDFIEIQEIDYTIYR